MDKAKETLLKVQTEVIYAAMTGSMKLPDPVLALALRAAKQAAGVSANLDDAGDRELLMRLEELEAYFRDKLPLSDTLREIVLRARPSQMKSVIRGYLVNYVYDW